MWSDIDMNLNSNVCFFREMSQENKNIAKECGPILSCVFVYLSFWPCHRKYSQSECRKPVVNSSVFHRTFPSISAFHLSHTQPSHLATVFSMAWYEIIMQPFHVTCIFLVYTPTKGSCVYQEYNWLVGYSMVYRSNALHNWYITITFVFLKLHLQSVCIFIKRS